MAARELWGTDPFALIGAAAACADAELGPDAREGVGDRTKIAILAATFAWGIRRAEIERSNPSVTEQPFDQALKGMSIARADVTTYIKGAIGSVPPMCDDVPILAQAANTRMAECGLGVFAVAIAPSRTARARFEGLIRLVGRWRAAESMAAGGNAPSRWDEPAPK